MNEPTSATVELACELIRRESVTPADAGCQPLLAERLGASGFTVENMPFGGVSNLWCRRGSDGPLFVFLGHTDVVPTGPATRWQTAPFEPTIRDGLLHGRGAADMKGSVAAFVTASERFVAAHPDHRGSIGLLLTSDEEGPADDGTVRVVETLDRRGERIDYCLVGEPSSEARAGDIVKTGRRGSLNGRLVVRGVQGHVAYPHKASNPVHLAAPALLALVSEHWDDGNASFPPTTFQISNVNSGTGATNVIPGELEILFNFRYSTEVTADELKGRVHRMLERYDLDYSIDWKLSARPFLTESGALVEAVSDAVAAVNGSPPELSTAGGTSDGRFVAPLGAQIVELGPVNATIHQVDEHVGVADLDRLSSMYEGVLTRLLVP